jgi:RNA polymerase sigma-70 factor (ECF subfamily)
MDQNDVVRTLIRDRARLLGYVWAIARDPHLADDVFQDVTVLAMERAGEIADEKHLARWARRAARFKALEALRKRGRGAVPLADEVMDQLADGWDGDDPHAAGEDIEHLRACVQTLTPHARTLIGLRYAEEVSGARVAEVMRVKVRSVYVALARIHRALGDCVRRRREAAGVPRG